MKMSKKIVLTALACAGLFAAITVISPKIVRAQFSNSSGLNFPGSPTYISDVNNPAWHPFQATCNGSEPSNYVQCTATTVKAGEELVITGVTTRLITNPGLAVDVEIYTSVGGTEVANFLPIQPLGACTICEYTNSEIWEGVLSTPIYADPGTSVYVTATYYGGVPAAGVYIIATVNGHTVTLP
jgi:hypothetical protein